MAHAKVSKLIENEAKFRQFNEALKTGLDDLENVAIKHGQPDEVSRLDGPFYFYCECSDETCTKRVFLGLKEYTEIHKNRKQFIIVPGHEVAGVEEVVQYGESYNIARKIVHPPEVVDHLHATTVNNV